MIYLASPYSHPDSHVKAERANLAAKAASLLMRKGYFIFSPITHTHAIALHGLPEGWDFWEGYDKEYLKWCKEMIVLRIDGWEQSKGVQAEIKIMQELGKPISYMTLISDKYYSLDLE